MNNYANNQKLGYQLLQIEELNKIEDKKRSLID